MNPKMRSLCILLVTLALGQAGPASAQSGSHWRRPLSPEARQQLRQATQGQVMAALQASDRPRALLILERALDRGLPAGDYHLLRAQVCAAERDVQGEEDQLRGALRADPSLTDASLRLAQILTGRGLWQEATDVLRSAIEANPGDVRSRLLLADLLTSQRRPHGAVSVLLQALEVQPEDTRILAALGAVYERLGEFSEAREAYRRAAAAVEEPRRETYLLKVADLSAACGDYVRAYQEYRAVVKQDTEIAPALYARIARATDEAVWGLLGPAWEALERYESGGPDGPVREEVYAAVSQALEAAREVTAFMDGLRVPASVRANHARRRFQNSVVCETLVHVVSYLDTGDSTLLATARGRRQEAALAREALLAQTGARSQEGL